MHGRPETTLGTMDTHILEATVPRHAPPNFCDYIRTSRFATYRQVLIAECNRALRKRCRRRVPQP